MGEEKAKYRRKLFDEKQRTLTPREKRITFNWENGGYSHIDHCDWIKLNQIKWKIDWINLLMRCHNKTTHTHTKTRTFNSTSTRTPNWTKRINQHETVVFTGCVCYISVVQKGHDFLTAIFHVFWLSIRWAYHNVKRWICIKFRSILSRYNYSYTWTGNNSSIYPLTH